MAEGPSWSEWLARQPLFATATAAVARSVTGRTRTFSSSKTVHEEQRLPHLGGMCFRARCLEDTALEYDLRHLEPATRDNGSGAAKDSSSAGATRAAGFVTLDAFKAVEREVALMTAARNHPHVTGLHAVLVENVGRLHTRLLLCDPCVDSLAGRLDICGGSLSSLQLSELGRQLALGLEHLHSCEILCGSITPSGVLLGCDGAWKLGDFSCASRLPLSAAQWHEQLTASRPGFQGRTKLLHGLGECMPPEARSCDEATITQDADVWLLGRLLATLLVGASTGGAIFEQQRGFGDTLLTVSTDALLDVVSARLWLLLHWMLAAEPTQRPKISEIHTLLDALEHASPESLLQMMPGTARFHCSSTAFAAVRKLAADQAADVTLEKMMDASKRRAMVSHLTAGKTLEKLRDMVHDPFHIDTICDNCGVKLESESLGPVSYWCESPTPSLTPLNDSSSLASLTQALDKDTQISPWDRRSACGHWSRDDVSTSDDSDRIGAGHRRDGTALYSSSDSDGSEGGHPDSPRLVEVGGLPIVGEFNDGQRDEEKKDR
jgi:serine/threonine protein kinase